MKETSLFNSETKNNFKVKNFKHLVSLWNTHHVEHLKITTKIRYKFIAKKFFNFFNKYQVNEITPPIIDLWLSKLRDKKLNEGRKTGFAYELRVLGSIFYFFREYSDDYSYQVPIRKRHFAKEEMASKKTPRKSKNLTPDEFLLFHKKLRAILPKKIKIVLSLVLLQYWHALRVSEIAAIHWEDLFINETHPERSFLRINRSLKWIRGKIILEDGFKNSNATDGFKDLLLFPVTYRVFLELKRSYEKNGTALRGLVFRCPVGEPLRYRQIQYYYDRAFKNAGLAYSGTHIMRHGGSRRLYAESMNLETAKQLLGNTDMATTKLYLEDNNEALVQAILVEWKKAS